MPPVELMNKLFRNPLQILLPALLLTFVMAGCGPNVIKGRPPFISISGMSLLDGELSAVFDISNQNGVPMNITSIDITVTVRDAEITRYNQDFQLEIDTNSTEEVSVDKLPDDFTRTLLASLEKGDLKSLPFDLNGRVNTVEDGFLKFENTGYLYPVPGRPNHYRSAVTQSKGLRREDL